jgi:putative transposase
MAYGIDYRRRVISFVNEGGSKREAARLFKVHPDTIYEWLKRGEDLSPRPAKHRQRKLDKRALEQHVKRYPDMLLRERAALYSVHESSMSRAVRKLGFVKKTT